MENKYQHKPILPMCGASILCPQSITGSNNIQIGGNAIFVNAGGAIEKALDQMAKAHELLAKMHEDANSRLAKSQEEIDRLISIIEKQLAS